MRAAAAVAGGVRRVAGTRPLPLLARVVCLRGVPHGIKQRTVAMAASGGGSSSSGGGGVTAPPVAVAPAPAPAPGAADAVPRTFDKAMFDSTVVVPAVRVSCREVQGLLTKLKPWLLELPRTRNVTRVPDDDAARLILLQPGSVVGGSVVGGSVMEGTVVEGSAAPAASHDSAAPAAAAVAAAPLSDAAAAAVAAAGGTFVTTTATVGYDQLTSDVVLRRLLPPAIRDIPSSMEIAGKLGHLNLRDDQFPYRYLIGAVLLDKNPVLRTIVAKTGVIDTTFRTFPMEVIAGDGDTNVELRHAGATFRFDFKTVYWNSRLAGEHEHIVTRIPPGAVVADMFCGVGPFAIPLARPPHACRVYANDLNPASYAALVDNARRNKVAAAVACYNMDGRAFIRAMVAAGIPFQYVLMNLPADAITFLDVFVGVYATAPRAAAPPPPLPHIFTYCFSRGASLEDARLDVTARVLAALSLAPPPPPPPATGSITPSADAAAAAALTAAAAALLPGLVVREVRDVAPNKLMMCAEFRLPHAVAYAATAGARRPRADSTDADGDAKRARTADAPA